MGNVRLTGRTKANHCICIDIKLSKELRAISRKQKISVSNLINNVLIKQYGTSKSDSTSTKKT